ncbi:MAG: acyclic terpene utilization AtuA family protein [Clostridiales bacterium]|nr:acyclic terpene utilization AtuA family protein [Clostridiales bacterium]MDY2833789.1 acyclic terpene utilization AtuA family protein [Candidatus Aphodomonas sp.]
MEKTVILSPCGILGYGFPEKSLWDAMEQHPDAIIVDAGSTDAGPHKLGAGVAIVSRKAAKIDLSRLMHAAHGAGIPLLIGSAGGSGARKHTDWTLDIIEEIAREMNWKARIAVIYADIPYEDIRRARGEGRIEKMSPNVPDLTDEALEKTNGVVAQMGVEPILKALEQKPDIVLCGRAYDPAPFAAFGVMRGHDPALCQHLGKILECGALCAEPGSAKDVMLGQLDETGFEVWPANPERRCNVTSVAAHTFYEKDHPTLLHGPGVLLDLSGCRFEQVAENRVRVTGSRMLDTPYTIKLEGARLAAYRTFVLAGIRDPLLIACMDEVEKEVVRSVDAYYGGLPEDVQIHFFHYGKDAVMGPLEPTPVAGHEIGLMFEVIAPTQETANAVCASVRSTYLHYGYPGRKSTAGNLAFPFAPSDVPFGPVYAFSVYHLMHIDDPLRYFPIEMREVEPA